MLHAACTTYDHLLTCTHQYETFLQHCYKSLHLKNSDKQNKIKTHSAFLLLCFEAEKFYRVVCKLILFRSNSFQCPPFYGNSFQCPPFQANSSQCPPVSGLRELKIPVLDAIRNDSLLSQHLKKAKNS